MSTTGDKEKVRIDLGLGALLARLDDDSPADVTIDMQRAHGPSNGPTADTARSEYDVLADRREWAQIVRTAEAHLGTDKPVEAQLWWIRGHLGAFSMPVTLLAAPMEALCRTVDRASLTQPLDRLLEETACLTLARLEEVGQRAQCKSLQSAMAKVGITPERQANGRTRKGTSSFRAVDILAEAPVSDGNNNVGVVRQAPSRTVRVALGATLLLGCLITAIWDPFGLLSEPLDTVRESFILDSSGVEQSLTVLERKDPAGRLGAVFYAIDDLSKDLEPYVGERLSKRNGAAPTADEGGASALSNLADVGRDAPKERVDTRGPVEGAEFRSGIESRRASAHEVPGNAELRGGPPQAVLPVPPRDQALEAGRVYEVITSTSVVSAPSFGGRVIGQLSSGDRVLVEGKLGRWLRLRSKRGRGGYVLAVDVQEVGAPREP